MVLDPPKPVPKPKPNRALADPWCRGANADPDHASSEEFGLHDDQPERQVDLYTPISEANGRHRDDCACLFCWWTARIEWRIWEATDGALPSFPRWFRVPPHQPKNIRQYNELKRIVRQRLGMSIKRLRRAERWYARFCKLRSYPTAAVIDNIFGDDETIVEIDEPEQALSMHAAAMERARVTGTIFYEGEGHHAGERDVYGEQRTVEMIRDAEAGQ